MTFKLTAKTDTGTARAVNEDYYGLFEEHGLVVVCDGMGGHNAGASASKMAVETVAEMYISLDDGVLNTITPDVLAEDLSIASRLVGAIRLANKKLFNAATESPQLRGMGTTISALALRDGRAIIGHIGDSRVYRFRQGEMELLTEDHTWLNELILDKEIEPQHASKFADRNVITRALGLDSTVKIDLRIEPLKAGDVFLLCTDGLTKALSDDEIKRIVLFNKDNFKHTVNHLLDTANIMDGSDNITALLVAIEKTNEQQRDISPISFTLKREETQISRLENKILRSRSLNQLNSINRIRKFLKLEKFITTHRKRSL